MSNHIDWPYGFYVVWFAERGQLLLYLDQRCDVFVITPGAMPEDAARIRCFRLPERALDVVIAPVGDNDTVRFMVQDQEVALSLRKGLDTGSSQIVALSGQSKPDLDIETFDGTSAGVADIVRELYEVRPIEHLRAIWQARIDIGPAENTFSLGPAQRIWPFGGKCIITATVPAPAAPQWRRPPPYAVTFSTTDTSFKLARLQSPVRAALLAVSWSSVAPDRDLLPESHLRDAFLKDLNFSAPEPGVGVQWPLRDGPQEKSKEFPLIDLEARLTGDLDVGDILVVCACSLPGWDVSLVANQHVIQSLSARDVGAPQSRFGPPHFQALCWRVEPDRLVHQPWAEIDERALRHLKARIGELADDVMKLRDRWENDVDRELSAYGGAADFEAAAATNAELTTLARAGEIFQLGDTDDPKHAAVASWLEQLPIEQWRKLLRLSGLPIDNVVQLLPLDLSTAPLNHAQDWRDIEDVAGQLCALLRDLWDRLGERNSDGQLLVAPGTRLREFSQLPKRIQHVDELLPDADGRHRKLSRALSKLQSSSLPVDVIKPVYENVQKFAVALDAAMGTANEIIERLPESLPDARNTTLTVPALMAASQMTESDLTKKLPEDLSKNTSLRDALRRIANSTSLSDEGKARLRGVILAFGEQGRRVTAVAGAFLKDIKGVQGLRPAQAEAYVRSVFFAYRRNDWPRMFDRELDRNEAKKLADLLKHFPSFAEDDARPWVRRVIAIRHQLEQEERLHDALNALCHAGPPSPAEPSGKSTLTALRSLLASSSSDPDKLSEVLDTLSPEGGNAAPPAKSKPPGRGDS